MNRIPTWMVLPALLLPLSAVAQETAREAERSLGMTVIGDSETPRTLIIVPWKPALPGELIVRPLQHMLEASAAPLDPEVLRRELRYRAVEPTP